MSVHWHFILLCYVNQKTIAMKKLFLLIPAALILTVSMAQNAGSTMSKGTASLDGKSYKITLSNLSDMNTNTPTKDNSQMNPNNKPNEMGTKDQATMDKRTGTDQAGADKNASAKTATLKFKDGMLKSSFTGGVKAKDCAYTTTSSAAATDAISFTASCSNDMNTGDKSMKSSGDMSSTNSSGSTATSPNSKESSESKMNSATTSSVEWTGTVSGNNINGTVKISDNGQYTNYSYTGTLMDMSGQLGMEE